ncbi:hypothetical protein [Azospirillum sp. sgz302134]
MKKNHSLARLIVTSGVALVSLLAAAASAAVVADVKPQPVPARIDWKAITDTANESFLFN